MYRQLLKTYVSHSEQLDLNKNAPTGKRWCNFLCQDFINIDKFYTEANRVSGLCIECEKKNETCKRYIKAGRLTKEQFRENPNILEELKKPIISDGVFLQCVGCKENKTKDKFDHYRNECKDCRRKQQKERTKQGLDKNIEDIELLKNNIPALELHLKYISADKIQAIMKHYNITRNSKDKKIDMLVKLANFFRQLQNPFQCLGNCGFVLAEQFSYCEICKIKPTTNINNENLEFKENLPIFMENIQKLTDDDQFKYNLYCIHAIAEFLDIKLEKTKGRTKKYYIDQINEKLATRKRPVTIDTSIELNGVIILTREDGFVNATQLCKAGRKSFADWKRLETTKELIQTLENELKNDNMGIPMFKLLDIKQGKSGGSWIHPDLAIQLAQWISPLFALKVSKWIRELAVTGTVILGNEKTNNQILSLQNELKVSEEKYEKSLQKRHYHKFKKGPVFYILSDTDSTTVKYKVGIDNENINARLQVYRTHLPGCKLEFLAFTNKNKLIEDNMIQRYDKFRKYTNHEWIYDMNIEHLINSVNTITNFLNIDITIENTIQQYNDQTLLDENE